MTDEIESLIQGLKKKERIPIYRFLLNQQNISTLTTKQKATLHYLKVQATLIRIKAMLPQTDDSILALKIIERALMDLHLTSRNPKAYRHYKTAIAFRKWIIEGSWLDRHLENYGFARHEYLDKI